MAIQGMFGNGDCTYTGTHARRRTEGHLCSINHNSHEWRTDNPNLYYVCAMKGTYTPPPPPVYPGSTLKCWDNVRQKKWSKTISHECSGAQDLHTSLVTFEECKQLCIETPNCHHIDYAKTTEGDRCTADMKKCSCYKISQAKCSPVASEHFDTYINPHRGGYPVTEHYVGGPPPPPPPSGNQIRNSDLKYKSDL